MANAWDMRPKETPLAYAAFRIYLQLGTNRSFKKAAELTPCNDQMASKWARRHEWTKRIREFEQYQMDVWIMNSIGVIKQNSDQIVSDMLKDYNEMLGMLRIKQQQTLDKMIEDPDSVSFGELTQLANARKTVDDLGRRAVNLPSTIKVEESNKPDRPTTIKSVTWANAPKLPSGDEDV